MRDYELMRNMLMFADQGEHVLNDFAYFGAFDPVRQELCRLIEEGLVDSDINFERSCGSGKVRGLTRAGKAFLRDIENERVWFLVRQTLDAADLDLSHPLLKKVCETIVERYVMGKIPESI